MEVVKAAVATGQTVVYVIIVAVTTGAVVYGQLTTSGGQVEMVTIDVVVTVEVVRLAEEVVTGES